MYKYADTTYPLYEAVSIETSLLSVDSLVLFRFEFVQGRSAAAVADYFGFTALYKFRDRVISRDVFSLDLRSRLLDTTAARDSFHFTSRQHPVEASFAYDSFRSSVILRRFERTAPVSRVSVRAFFRLFDKSLPVVVARVRATLRQKDSVFCGESFSMGRGVSWREPAVVLEVLACSCRFSFVDALTASEFYKIRGGKEREEDSSNVADVFRFSAVSPFVGYSSMAEAFFISNPHLSSFLLGDTSPLDTALGGRIYA